MVGHEGDSSIVVGHADDTCIVVGHEDDGSIVVGHEDDRTGVRHGHQHQLQSTNTPAVSAAVTPPLQSHQGEALWLVNMLHCVC